MASFGLRYLRFSPIAEEPENALPKYKGPVTLGKAVKADLTVTVASGELYAEDALAESVDEFVSGSLAVETDDMTDETCVAVYGCTLKEKELIDKAADSTPVGGVGYYKVLIRNGVKSFRGYVYPRCKAILGNDTAATKGNSITFGTNPATFKVFRCNDDSWRLRETFDTEAAAKAWIDEKLAAASAA